MYKLKIHKSVESDLKKLDKITLKKFEKKLKQILIYPELWKDLWNKNWINLSWYKKVYFDNKKYRIVYKIEKNELFIYIVSVWKRDNMQVYKMALQRINVNKN